MRKNSLLFALCLGSLLMACPSLAQKPTEFQSEYLVELQVPSSQIVALAEAVPPQKYSWRPGAGVRSISEVYVHVAAGNFLLLDIAGVKAPDDLYRSLATNVNRAMAIVKKNDELEKTITSKPQVIDLLKRSLAAVKDNFSKATVATLNGPADFFGTKTTVRAVYLRILAHNNEHMGQSVAYARMNGIVPPWSR
jgi:uncharacterized damage-inducible protein DinB